MCGLHSHPFRNLKNSLRNRERGPASVETLGASPILAGGATRCAGREAASVGSGQDASSQGRPRSKRHAVLPAVRVHFPLFLPIHQVVMVLHGHERCPTIHRRDHLKLDELPGEHRRSPQVKGLARFDHFVKRFERFLDRHVRQAANAMRMAMDDKEIDVVQTEALEAGVHSLQNMLARQPGFVRVQTHGVGHLGRDDILLPRKQLPKQRSHDFLRSALAVHIGGVEEEQAVIQCHLEHVPRLVRTQGPVALMPRSGLAKIHGPQAEPGDHHATVVAEGNGIKHRGSPALKARTRNGSQGSHACRSLSLGPILAGRRYSGSWLQLAE